MEEKSTMPSFSQTPNMNVFNEDLITYIKFKIDDVLEYIPKRSFQDELANCVNFDDYNRLAKCLLFYTDESGFTLFAEECTPMVTAESPELSAEEVAKVVRTTWTNLSLAEKQEFNQRV